MKLKITNSNRKSKNVWKNSAENTTTSLKRIYDDSVLVIVQISHRLPISLSWVREEWKECQNQRMTVNHSRKHWKVTLEKWSNYFRDFSLSVKDFTLLLLTESLKSKILGIKMKKMKALSSKLKILSCIKDENQFQDEFHSYGVLISTVFVHCASLWTWYVLYVVKCTILEFVETIFGHAKPELNFETFFFDALLDLRRKIRGFFIKFLRS